MPLLSRDQWLDTMLSECKFSNEDTARQELIEYWQLSNCLFASDPEEIWFKTVGTAAAGAASCAMGYLSWQATLFSSVFGFFAGAKTHDYLHACSQRLTDGRPIVDLQARLAEASNPDVILSTRLCLFRDCMKRKNSCLLIDLFKISVTNVASAGGFSVLLPATFYSKTARSAAVVIATSASYFKNMDTVTKQNINPHFGIRYRPHLRPPR